MDFRLNFQGFPSYRLDIQGLRAVAIMAVVIYHLNPGWLPGGFVGVDVFFVISGFLITTILSREKINKTTLIGFYSSRIVRLFPAYFVLLVACSIATYFWLFPKQTVGFSQSLFTSVFYVSNVYFAATINYLSVDSHLLPLLHTWSLSAEAQCYLVFPIVLYFLISFKKLGTGIGLLILLLLMFVLNLVLTASNADIAFFSPVVRFYQFLAGAVLVFLPTSLNSSKRLMNLCLIGGLGLIFLSFFIITPRTNYPGIWSLLPTLGSVLVIFSGRCHQLYSATLLTNTPMLFIGAISYSLYLWHWPLIVYYKIVFNPQLYLLDYCLLTGLSLLMATISWYFVEHRFRLKAKPIVVEKIFTANLAAIVFLILISNIYLYSNGLKYRHTAQQLYFAETDFSQNNREKKITDSCMIYKNRIESFTEENCVHFSENKPNVLLLGDSHAEHLRRALEDDNDKISLSVATVSACRPTLHGTGRSTCQLMMHRFYNELIKKYKFDVVIVSAKWSMETIEQMPKAINILKENIRKVIVLGPIISYTQSLPGLLARYGTNLNSSNIRNIFSRYDEMKSIDLKFRRIIENSGADYISLLDLICPDQQCQVLTKSGVPLQWDYGHLTYAGAVELIGKFKTRLNE